MCLLTNTAYAAQDDWFGPDKALHACLSAAIAGGGYTLGVYAFEDRGVGLLVGSGLALGAGAVKELVDLAGYGQPSVKDLAWDAIGTLFGLALAYGLDLLIRSTPSKGPPVLAPLRPVAHPWGVVIRF